MVALMTVFLIFSADTLSFTLDQAIDYALVNSPEIKQLDIAYQKAQTGMGQARSAFYPSLSATGYFAYLSDVPVFVLDSMMIPMGQHENYSLQVSLQQVLFTWGKIYDAYRIAGLSTDVAELSLLRKKQEVRASVTKAFYGILVLEEMVRLSNESLNQLLRHQESVQKRYDAGLVPQFDLLRARVQVANVKPMVIQAENGLKLARTGFKLLLGIPAASEFSLSGDLEMTPEEFDLSQLSDSALANRIELKNLERVEKIAHLSQSIVRRANLPTIIAGTTYEKSKPYGLGGSEWGSNITFNVGFQFPLFSGFKNLYQYKEACLAIKEAQLARETLEKTVALEVEQAYLNWTAAREAIAAAQENVLQAEKAVEIIETRYKNGLATNLEFMDAQLASMQAKTNYLNALKDYHSALADLNKATGKEE